MTTPTLLRVKRRKNEDPKDVLILSAKKRKADDTESDEESEKQSEEAEPDKAENITNLWSS